MAEAQAQPQPQADAHHVIEETAQFSAIASLFLFAGLAINAFTTASKTNLDNVWRQAGASNARNTSPHGVIVGFVLVGVCYLVAAGFASYVAYVVSKDGSAFTLAVVPPPAAAAPGVHGGAQVTAARYNNEARRRRQNKVNTIIYNAVG